MLIDARKLTGFTIDEGYGRNAHVELIIAGGEKKSLRCKVAPGEAPAVAQLLRLLADQVEAGARIIEGRRDRKVDARVLQVVRGSDVRMVANSTALAEATDLLRDNVGGKKIAPGELAAARRRAMRLLFPYGIWECGDGRQVLFNRAYMPIWQRARAGAAAEPANPDEWVKAIALSGLFYRGGAEHWRQRANITRAESILAAFQAGRDVSDRIIFSRKGS
jgi:hypothetical protein